MIGLVVALSLPARLGLRSLFMGPILDLTASRQIA
jgi:hypothetical protein